MEADNSIYIMNRTKKEIQKARTCTEDGRRKIGKTAIPKQAQQEEEKRKARNNMEDKYYGSYKG